MDCGDKLESCRGPVAVQGVRQKSKPEPKLNPTQRPQVETEDRCESR